MQCERPFYFLTKLRNATDISITLSAKITWKDRPFDSCWNQDYVRKKINKIHQTKSSFYLTVRSTTQGSRCSRKHGDFICKFLQMTVVSNPRGTSINFVPVAFLIAWSVQQAFRPHLVPGGADRLKYFIRLIVHFAYRSVSVLRDAKTWSCLPFPLYPSVMFSSSSILKKWRRNQGKINYQDKSRNVKLTKEHWCIQKEKNS